MATTIKFRRGTASQWTAANPILAEGEFGYEIDTEKHKVGDGVKTWSLLQYHIPESSVQELVDSIPVAPVVTNLLTDNQASGTDTLGNTTGFSLFLSSTATITSSPDVAAQGSRSLKAVAVGTYIAVSATSVAIKPGQVYTTQVSIRSGGVVTGQVSAKIDWRNATDSASVGSTEVWVPPPVSTAWTRVSVTGVAPATAMYARITVNTDAVLTAGNTYYFDKFGLWAGAGGDWAMPGIPVTNVGTQITHPNVDDVLAQQWDSSKGQWQTVHYDSGWRDITALVLATELTASKVSIRRVGHTVDLRVYRAMLVKGAAAGANGIQLFTASLPGGFRPYGASTSAWGVLQDDGAGYRIPWTISLDTNGLLIAGTGGIRDAATRLSGSVSGTTTDLIPTSLPGTLIVAAPKEDYMEGVQVDDNSTS